MNDNLTKARPRRPRITQFKSVQQFWTYHTNHPEAFSQMDFTGIAEMAEKVRERTQNPLPASGSCRAEGSSPNPNQPEPTRANPDKSEQKNVPNGNKTASKNGKERDRTGENRAFQTEPTRTNPDKTEQPYKVGPGNPPKEHQFQPGNPGGPGGPLGPRSMRKYIRTILFGDEVEDGFASEVAKALFRQAFKGNTHAIRIICENGNNRRKRT